MNIKTNFNIGDKVFTIDTRTLKVKDFEVKRISTFTSDGKTTITLYDDYNYMADGYDENKCFSTEKELMTFITTKNDAKTL